MRVSQVLLLLGLAVLAGLPLDDAQAQSRRRVPSGQSSAPAAPQGGGQQQPTREELNLIRLFPTNERLAVQSFNGKPLGLADRPVFTMTDAQRMTGFGGCNSVSADFRLVPKAIRFGPLSFTTNKCGPEVDKTELAVFRAFQFAETWKPAGPRMISISGRGGTVVLAPAF